MVADIGPPEWPRWRAACSPFSWLLFPIVRGIARMFLRSCGVVEETPSFKKHTAHVEQLWALFRLSLRTILFVGG